MSSSSFINKIAPIVVADMQKTGILASLTLAQACLESYYGTSNLTKKANNLFGMKGKYKGKSYGVYRKYDSWSDSIADHSGLFLRQSRYKNLRGCTDYKKACRYVQQAGYAEDSGYANKLINLIQKYKLYQYDKKSQSSTIPSTKNTTTVIDKVLKYMNQQLGKAYSQSNRFGANSFDCSSLVYRAFLNAGVKLVHKDNGRVVNTSSEEVYAKDFKLLYPSSYSKVGKNLPSPSNTLSRIGVKPGDVVFYNSDSSTSRANRITHVGTVTSDNKIIHAANPREGVKKSALSMYSTRICAVIRYKDSASTIYSGNDNGSTSDTNTSKPITSTVTYTSGSSPRARDTVLLNYNNVITNDAIELIIRNGQTIYAPMLKDEITWETERKGTPSILKFTVVKDQDISFFEGNAVRLKVNGKNIFYGFIFLKKRDKEHHIQVTAYDQLRYFKNKDIYVYSSKRADEVVKMIAKDYKLNIGSLENTQYKIPSKIEDNKTLFDIVQNALDETLTNKKKMYILYDDFGKITLKGISKLTLNLLIDEDTGENFSYTSSIDGETYNRVKLVYDNTETGTREIYIAQHGVNMNKWGILQYFEKLNSNVNAKAKADSYLQLYNQKTRNLTINNALGDLRVRGGSLIGVKLNIGDIITNNYMLVDKVKHTITNDENFMDLTLIGGEFIA